MTELCMELDCQDYKGFLTGKGNFRNDIAVTVPYKGQRVADKPEKGWFLTVKSNYAIQPFDKDGKEIKDIVGNGSKAIALIKPYSWKWKNKEGVSASLSKIVITDLIKYNADGGDTAIEDLDDDIL